ncbi:MAG: Calx-beta domain-containing protein [Planctomycetota bacterium]
MFLNTKQSNYKHKYSSTWLIAAAIASMSLGGCHNRSGGKAVGGAGIQKSTISFQNNTILEGNAGSANITFTISLDVAATGAINFRARTTSLTAQQGVDYAAFDQIVTINPGQTTAQINIQINGDTDVELDETFRLTLSNVSGTAKFGNTTATATILNDDVVAPPPPPAGPGKILYFAEIVQGESELFVTDFAGSQHTRVSPPLGAGGDVRGEPILSPNKSKVLIYVELSGSSAPDAFVVNVDGSGFVKLSDAAGLGENILHFSAEYPFVWSPDSSKVFFRSSLNGQTELYISNVDGSNRIKANTPLALNHDIDDKSRWSPDGTRLLYVVKTGAFSLSELHVVNADGTGHFTLSTKLNNNLSSPAVWAPDSSRIVAAVDENSDNDGEVVTMLPDGTNKIQLGPQAPGPGDEHVIMLGFSPDGSRVAMIIDDPFPNGPFQLWTDLALGGDAKKISTPLALPINRDVATFTWSPNGSKIVYGAEALADNIYSLFSANPDGTDHKEIGATNNSGGTIGLNIASTVGLEWTPDGTKVLYSGSLNASTKGDLYISDPLVANSGVRVTPSTSNNGSGASAAYGARNLRIFSPDSSKLLYRLDATTDNNFGLYTANVNGTNITLLPQTGPAGVEADEATWNSNGTKIIMNGAPSGQIFYDLFVMNADGSNRVKITPASNPDGIRNIIVID